MDFHDRPLGMRRPTDEDHRRKYPLMMPVPPDFVAERTLELPSVLRSYYDQGSEGACVGFSASWAMSIVNSAGPSYPLHRYDARRLYRRAQEVDEWPETREGGEEGTSVRAAFDVLREQGHVLVNKRLNPDGLWLIGEGVEENRWAGGVDEIRKCIQSGTPVVIGVNWYSAFDRPVEKKSHPIPAFKEWWIGDADLGSIRGGHAVCVYGASDRRQAVKIVNNWGSEYPLVWMPYSTLNRLIADEGGEATLMTDRLPSSVREEIGA